MTFSTKKIISKKNPLDKNERILGLDVGCNKTYTTNDNQVSKKDIHNWELKLIVERLSRRKKGSKGFQRTSEHRNNYINWSINQLNLKNIDTLVLENIKNVRKGRRTSRKMSHWTYTSIFDKLEMRCEDLGVQVKYVSPTFTSQMCSSCGWIRKSNRNGKLFKCTACGFTADADLNASINIGKGEPNIGYSKRLKLDNEIGFYYANFNGGVYSHSNPREHKIT